MNIISNILNKVEFNLHLFIGLYLPLFAFVSVHSALVVYFIALSYKYLKSPCSELQTYKERIFVFSVPLLIVCTLITVLTFSSFKWVKARSLTNEIFLSALKSKYLSNNYILITQCLIIVIFLNYGLRFV